MRNYSRIKLCLLLIQHFDPHLRLRSLLRDFFAADTGMAFPFLQLPPEIRNMIYRHLLAGTRVNFIRTANADTGYTVHSPNDRLHSEILRVSSMIYKEAVPILYSENRFCCLLAQFTKKTFTSSPFSLGPQLPIHRLANITHLDDAISILYEAQSANGICRDIPALLKHVRTLDTFSIKIELDACFNIHCKLWVERISPNTVFMIALASIRVTRVLQVTVFNGQQNTRAVFQALVDELSRRSRNKHVDHLCAPGRMNRAPLPYDSMCRWRWDLKLEPRPNLKRSISPLIGRSGILLDFTFKKSAVHHPKFVF